MARERRVLSRREFLGFTIAGARLTIAPEPVLAGRARPNILFILADDLGYGDLGSFGRPDYRTPNLDRLAAQGVRFTHAYSAGVTCTPTRCALATGRYPARLPIGLEEPLLEGRVGGLPCDHPTVASLLGAAGYETALIGKWHLGSLPENGPTRHGFGTFYGILSGAVDYFTHKNQLGTPDLYEDAVAVDRVGYLTDLLTDRAVSYVSRQRARPFFLSLHYTAPHWPWQGPDDRDASRSLGHFQQGGSLKIFADMVHSLDEGVGRVMQALRVTNQDRRTLVIFTSDNGGERYSFHWPLSDWKGSLWEGGIRVPAVVRWPGKVKAGHTTEQAAISMDWVATMLAGAGAPPDPRYPLDGMDLLPVCRGDRPPVERAFYWRTRAWRAGPESGPAQAAARVGRWKYLHIGQIEHLFDLSTDPGEDADLGSDHPEILEQLRTGFQKWNADMLPLPGVLEFPG